MTLKEVQHFSNIETVIDDLLQLFNRYDAHVTWATVGLLGYENSDHLIAENKNKTIPYTIAKYSPFPISSKKYGSIDSSLLLGHSEIKKIVTAKNQEFASHTFSHFYALEEGVSTNDFEADCDAMSVISKRYNAAIKSIVFPRNQINASFLEICANHGYSAYRGNQENRFWTTSAFEKESVLKRAGRLIDAYLKISKTKTFRIEQLEKVGGLVNIPANRFYRPHSGYRWLEIRKIKRIKHEMLKAAKQGTIYHLWWHPHNFLNRPNLCLAQLEELLAYSIVLQKKYDFKSLNMGEIASLVNA